MHDQERLRRQREETDRTAKESVVRQMISATAKRDDADAQPLVTLKELAAELRMDRSAARRYILRLGHKPMKTRTAESGYQEALVFTRKQADAIVAARRADGYC